MKLFIKSKVKNVDAVGEYNLETGEFVVLKGSVFSETVVSTGSFRGTRAILKAREGCVKDNVLLEDKTFSSSSTAANFVRGLTYGKGNEITDGSTNGIPVLRANNITLYKNLLNFDDVKYVNNSVKIKETQYLHKDDILICAGSGSKEHVGKVAFINEDMKCAFGGFMAVFRVKDNSEIISRYIFHILTSKRFREYIGFMIDASTIKNLNARVVANFKIPVPPIEVQSEIVKVLDNFTELTARKKQYSYYLNHFFENSSAESVPLTSLGTLTRGKRFVHADATDEGVPCIHYGELYTYYGVFADEARSHIREDLRSKMRYATKGDVIIVGAGENKEDIGVGVAWYGDEDVAVHDACYTLSHKQNPKYISYFLRSNMYHQQIVKYVYEGKICSISAENVGKALIPIPPIEEQDRIVSILDRFDKLCTDLSFGLPAEIEARRKQYEYYRDKLLSFNEA